MNQKLGSVLKFIFLLGLAAALLVFAFRGISLEKILNEILQAKMGWLLLSVAASLVAFVSRAYRWNLLIEPLGYTPKLKNTSYSLMVGYLANFAFPRLGEVSRCGSLSKAESVPFNSLLGTVIVERIVDVISMFICLLLTAVLEYDRLGDFLMQNIIRPIFEKVKYSIGSPVVIGGVVTFLLISIFVFRYFQKKSKQSGHESKALHLIKGLIDGLRSVGKLKRPFAFIFHTILIWIMYFLMAYLVFFALPFTSGLGGNAGLFVLVVGSLAMIVPVQGGIGAYHLLVSQGLMLYGLSHEDGLAFATLLHTSQFIVVVVFGAISLLLLFLGNKKVEAVPKVDLQ